MKGLYRVVPPFSSDISGACSVLFGLNGIVVVHEPACCTSSFTVYDEGGYYGSDSALYSSELREIHLAIGDDETLLRRLEAAARLVERDFIALVGSPLPMAAGTDFPALARAAERRTGLPTIVVEATGMKRYDDGASAALVAIAGRFASRGDTVAGDGPDPAAEGRSINVIGVNGMDFDSPSRGGELISLLGESGEIAARRWPGDYGIEGLGASNNAIANLVVSRSGLAVARVLESRFGTPFIVGLPVGASGRDSLMRELAAPRVSVADGGGGGVRGPALVVGEQVSANALRNCLREEFGYGPVMVASFFGLEESLSEVEDKHLADESEFSDLVGAGRYGTVVGDPLLRELCPADQPNFVPVPHIAISGAFPWNRAPCLIGEAGTRWIAARMRG
jgi:hypothetical protein